MYEGGIDGNDLVMIIGEQTISIRMLKQEKQELESQVGRLLAENSAIHAELEALREREGGDDDGN